LLRSRPRRGPGPPFLFDEQGKDVLGRPAPPGTEKLIAQTAQSGQSEFKLGDREAFAAVPVTSSQGHRYVLLRPLPPRPRRAAWMRMLRAAPRTQLLRILAVFLTAGMVCFWLARHLTAPVTKLRSATQQLAEGNLGVRVGGATNRRSDELAGLGRDFDVMAERIESLMNAQRRLLRDISHELRSPLARLNIALGLARQRSVPPASGALDRIEREAERLNELIGQLLRLTVLESGTQVEEKVSVPLADLMREIVADADFEARSRHCTVRLVAVEECVAVGRPDLLRSAIENVIRNAVRHTAEGTEVEVRLSCRRAAGDWSAVITVRDHGAGVPEAELAQLFQPFYRVGEARDQRTGGTGLGLAITERAVRLHGGAVAAANAPGGGLEMEIRLPAAAPEQGQVS
jgi:two-component system sensor histidine kinase CpxA